MEQRSFAGLARLLRERISTHGDASMPYATETDLPMSVRRHLPPHAQHIFRAAFNRAWKQYGADESRAFRVAWAAVEREYEKVADEWVPRERATFWPFD
jgi:cation transport regulator